MSVPFHFCLYENTAKTVFVSGYFYLSVLLLVVDTSLLEWSVLTIIIYQGDCHSRGQLIDCTEKLELFE